MKLQPATGTRSSAWPAEPRVVAIGETGLDLYWKDVPLAVQQDYFDRHIRLSQSTGKPLVIHLRETAAEIHAMLAEARKRGPLVGIMHCIHRHDPSRRPSFSIWASTSALPAW